MVLPAVRSFGVYPLGLESFNAILTITFNAAKGPVHRHLSKNQVPPFRRHFLKCPIVCQESYASTLKKPCCVNTIFIRKKCGKSYIFKTPLTSVTFFKASFHAQGSLENCCKRPECHVRIPYGI